MRNSWILKIATFAFIVFLIWLLAWLTMPPEEDPCDDPQTGVSAAVIADQGGDQEALVNRAIILRGKCEQDNKDKDKEKQSE
jgi:hypothetical protein